MIWETFLVIFIAGTFSVESLSAPSPMLMRYPKADTVCENARGRLAAFGEDGYSDFVVWKLLLTNYGTFTKHAMVCSSGGKLIPAPIIMDGSVTEHHATSQDWSDSDYLACPLHGGVMDGSVTMPKLRSGASYEPGHPESHFGCDAYKSKEDQDACRRKYSKGNEYPE